MGRYGDNRGETNPNCAGEECAWLQDASVVLLSLSVIAQCDRSVFVALSPNCFAVVSRYAWLSFCKSSGCPYVQDRVGEGKGWKGWGGV